MISGFSHSRRIALITGIAITISIIGSQSTLGVMAVQKRQPGPAIKLLSPTAGDVLQPGDQVTIAWELEGLTSSLTGCEQEIYLSTDHGKSVASRLTPELAPNVFSYQWTVPNLPTKKGVLVINFGCETSDGAFETSHPQKQATFKISAAPAGFEEVVLDSADKRAGSSGPEIDLRWHATFSDIDSYHVQVSYDRGAHFNTIGETVAPEFIWRAQPGFSGVLTFKIAAQKSEGGIVESIIDPSREVVLGRGQ